MMKKYPHKYLLLKLEDYFFGNIEWWPSFCSSIVTSKNTSNNLKNKFFYATKKNQYNYDPKQIRETGSIWYCKMLVKVQVEKEIK